MLLRFAGTFSYGGFWFRDDTEKQPPLLLQIPTVFLGIFPNLALETFLYITYVPQHTILLTLSPVECGGRLWRASVLYLFLLFFVYPRHTFTRKQTTV